LGYAVGVALPPQAGTRSATMIVRKTVDGAHTWFDITPPGVASTSSAAISCTDASTCLIDLSGSSFWTSNGGASWTKIHDHYGSSNQPQYIVHYTMLDPAHIWGIDGSKVWFSQNALSATDGGYWINVASGGVTTGWGLA